MKTLTILGGGWLGLATALELKKEYKIKISSRTEEKIEKYEDEGLSAFLLNEKNLDALDYLLDTNYLFINFPPSKFNDYLGFMQKIYNHKKSKDINKIIFISSTSIYPNEDGIFKEDLRIENPVSKIVYDCEELIKTKTDVIFRCAGLMGYNRIAGKYFSNKEIDGAEVCVNHVHRDDVILACKFVIKNDICGVFNLCSKEHPRKKELYLKNSKFFEFDKPIFINKKKYKNRIINSEKIEGIGFKYRYNNPMNYK